MLTNCSPHPQLSQVTLILASDGLWDVWSYKDVLKYPLRATAPDANGMPRTTPIEANAIAVHTPSLASLYSLRTYTSTLTLPSPHAHLPSLSPFHTPSANHQPTQEHLRDLMSETRAESAEMFGESADNITAVCVAFDRIVPKDLGT